MAPPCTWQQQLPQAHTCVVSVTNRSQRVAWVAAGEASITPTSTNKHCACWLASFQLQELIEDYLAHLARPGTPCKTFRIKVFVFMAAEEPLTPDEIMEGQHFFGYVEVGVHGRWRICARLWCVVVFVGWWLVGCCASCTNLRGTRGGCNSSQPTMALLCAPLPCCCVRSGADSQMPARLNAMRLLDGRSSFGSTLSSVGTPSTRQQDLSAADWPVNRWGAVQGCLPLSLHALCPRPESCGSSQSSQQHL